MKVGDEGYEASQNWLTAHKLPTSLSADSPTGLELHMTSLVTAVSPNQFVSMSGGTPIEIRGFGFLSGLEDDALTNLTAAEVLPLTRQSSLKTTYD